MKVVLFCGGQGFRLRDHPETSGPKPMVPIGARPIIWHVMKYYAHFGHNDFVLCLGYRADVVKDHFLSYNEALSNDFVLSEGGRTLHLLSNDISQWRITFADTGLHANIGQRLRAVRKYVAGEEVFLSSYGDTLTDAPLPELINDFQRRGKIAAFLSVRPSFTFHVITEKESGVVLSIEDVAASDIWINGGFFMFRQEIFDYLQEGEDLVDRPFQRLVDEEQLISYRYDGFYAAMDTLHDQTSLEALAEDGRSPWAIWQTKDVSLPPASL
jgi:glucose-1-phosphate cytidylyltransferase